MGTGRHLHRAPAAAQRPLTRERSGCQRALSCSATVRAVSARPVARACRDAWPIAARPGSCRRTSAGTPCRKRPRARSPAASRSPRWGERCRRGVPAPAHGARSFRLHGRAGGDHPRRNAVARSSSFGEGRGLTRHGSSRFSASGPVASPQCCPRSHPMEGDCALDLRPRARWLCQAVVGSFTSARTCE